MGEMRDLVAHWRKEADPQTFRPGRLGGESSTYANCADALEAELNARPGGLSPALADALNRGITDLQDKLKAAEVALVSARAELAEAREDASQWHASYTDVCKREQTLKDGLKATPVDPRVVRALKALYQLACVSDEMPYALELQNAINALTAPNA